MAPHILRSGLLALACASPPRETYLPQSEMDDSAHLGLVEPNAGGLSLAIRDARRNVGADDHQALWHRFVEWWRLPPLDGTDGRVVPDFDAELGGDLAFYAFELACLMREMGQRKAFAGRH